MKVNKWYICADDEHAQILLRGLRLRYPAAVIEHTADAGYLRTRLLKDEPGLSSVLVGEGCMTIDPINLAAALVRDGHACDVMLVQRVTSGSLRSRASRAGVTSVMEESEFVEFTTGTHVKKAIEGASLQHVSRAEQNYTDQASTPPSDASALVAPPAGIQAASKGLDMTSLSPYIVSGDTQKLFEAGQPARAADPQQLVPHSTTAGYDACGGLRCELDEPEHPRLPPLVKGLGLVHGHPLSKRPIPPVPQAPVICFASGRGGVGKTSIATVCACLAARWGLHCAFIDLDLSFGNSFAFFGQDRAADLSILSDANGQLAESCARAARVVREGLSLWGPCERPEMAETVVPHVGHLIAEVSSDVDLVICDSSSDWGDELASAAQLADRLILVSDERQHSHASLTRAAALAVRLGVARTRIVRVSNFCDAKAKSDHSFLHTAVGLETARSYEIEDAGDELRELLALGHAEHAASSQLPFTRSVAFFLSHTLQELGRLPDCAEAQKALATKKVGRMWSLFGLKREAV